MSKNKFLLIILTFVVLVSCKDEQPVIPTTFKIQPIVHVGIDAQEITVPFDTDAEKISTRFTTDIDWCNVKVSGQNFILSVKKNTEVAERNAILVITADDRVNMDSLKVIQNVMVTKLQVVDGWASSEQSSHEIKYSYDGIFTTSNHYHSNYAGGQLPVKLIYTLDNTSEAISAIGYHPRNGNGNFGEISISVKTEGDTDFKHVMDYDCKMKGTVSYINFPATIQNPREVQITVSSGAGNHASCTEMEFLLGGN